MNDVADLKNQFRAQLRQAPPLSAMPPELLERRTFKSCLRKNANGGKDLYPAARRRDNAKVLIQGDWEYSETDARCSDPLSITIISS